MPDITKIKIGNERERSYKDFPANREFKKRAEDDNPGGGWPADLPKPSVGGYGYTDEDEIVHKIDEKYLPASGGAMVVEVNYDGEQFVSTKTVDEVKNAMLTMPVIGIAKIMGEFMAVGIFSWLHESANPDFDASSPVMTVTSYTASPDDYEQVRVETLPLIVVSDGEFVINA